MNAVLPQLFSGKASSRISAILALSCAMLAPVMSAAVDWNIDQLMQSLAKAKPGRAIFVEKKHISILDYPVESSGELHYIAPDRLEKRTLKPKAENMVVDGNILTIERGQKKHIVRLQEYPELAAFVDSIRGTLAGDRKVLERSFRLKLDGGAERWTLQLIPADAAIGHTVHLIRIAGVRDNLRSIEVIQTNGDRSQMTIDRITTQ
jgi:hypothetical protein